MCEREGDVVAEQGGTKKMMCTVMNLVVWFYIVLEEMKKGNNVFLHGSLILSNILFSIPKFS